MTGNPVKCVVWDLDDTLWRGTLAEDPDVTIRPEILALLRTLDERGILHSIASRNEASRVRRFLEQQGIAEYFLYPEIHWGPKGESVQRISRALNIHTDAILLVDNDPFERDQVAAAVEGVRTAAPEQLDDLLECGVFGGEDVTEDARLRRSRYVADQRRQETERRFSGSPEEFTRLLRLKLDIRLATRDDLARAEELTVRTHQLNTSGRAYSIEELEALRRSDTHELLVADCQDRYGSYGTIGLVLLGTAAGCWTVKLLIMSCRVMNRGVGSLTLAVLTRMARRARVRLRAEFVPNDRNRVMHVMLRLGGFRRIAQQTETTLLELDPEHVVVDATDAEVTCAPIGRGPGSNRRRSAGDNDPTGECLRSTCP